MKYINLLLIMSCLLSNAAYSDRIDDFIKEEMEDAKIPGLSLVIMRAGNVVKSASYGFANVEHNVSVTPDTLFQSGSTAKQFTAAMVLLLVEQDKLGLNNPLAYYFDSVPSVWHTITIRHLLTHTSGIKDYGREDLDYRRDYKEDELIEVIKKMPVQFVPGSQWSYSNSGYVILGVLISSVTGEHWGEFARKNIFEPLKMKTADVISDAKIVPNRAAGYVFKEDKLENQWWVSPTFLTTGDGALYFSSKDLVAWETALRNRTLLSPNSMKEWWSPVKLTDGTTFPYGFGWFINEQRGYRTIEHGGSWQGFLAGIARYPDNDLMISILLNVDSARPMEIIHAVAGIVEPKLKLPQLHKLDSNPDIKQDAMLKNVLKAWSTWHSIPEMGRGLADTASGSKRESFTRRSVGKQLADLKRFGWLENEDVSKSNMSRRGYKIENIAHYVLETSEEKIRYRFYLTSLGHVADFALR
jgi:CubicO group peptidase (beta-lactamase class C family)